MNKYRQDKGETTTQLYTAAAATTTTSLIYC